MYLESNSITFSRMLKYCSIWKGQGSKGDILCAWFVCMCTKICINKGNVYVYLIQSWDGSQPHVTLNLFLHFRGRRPFGATVGMAYVGTVCTADHGGSITTVGIISCLSCKQSLLHREHFHLLHCVRAVNIQHCV